MGGKPFTVDDIHGAFAEPIPPIVVPAGYRLRLLAVLVGLVLLQSLYLLLVAFVMAATGIGTLAVWGSGIPFNVVTILVYLGTPATGIVTTLFLLKPVLIRPPRAARALELKGEDQPVLFAYVGQLCEAVRAPGPRSVRVDLQVNASAAVRGWRGFFLGDLELTIGMPLAMGLTLEQFTGVLAHEFGHFAQRAGLRTLFLIQTIRQWFARVVYQRDNWDAWLERSCEHGDWRVWLVARLARQVVKASRWYLTLLMKAGGWLSRSFSRQMEFDADRYEAAIAGVDVFAETSMRLPVLGWGARLAWEDVSKEWSMGRLPDDVARLIAERTADLGEESVEQITKQVAGQVTKTSDTHPAPTERIEAVRRFGAEGVLRLTGAPGQLFRDVEGVCKAATRHHYETVLRVELDRVRLVGTGETVRSARQQRAYDAAVWALFAESPEFVGRWMRLPGRGTGGGKRLDREAYARAVETNLLHFAGLVIRSNGVRVNAPTFRLSETDVVGIRAQEAASRRYLEELRAAFNAYARPVAEEMERAVERGRGLTPGAERAWACSAALAQCREELDEIRRLWSAHGVVRENGRLFQTAACANILEDLDGRMRGLMEGIRKATAEVPASVILDPRAEGTVGAQLGAHDAEVFLRRSEVLASVALSHLAWWVLEGRRGMGSVDEADG